MRKVVVIGGGHNGLVCGAYLARAGYDTTLLERDKILGGAARTEEVWEGIKTSRASYLLSLMPEKIKRELELERHGLEILERNPSGLSLFPDGSYLAFHGDPAELRTEIAKFSEADADAYPAYEANLAAIGRAIEPAMLRPPPSLESMPSLAWDSVVNRKLWDHRFTLTDLMGMSGSEFLDQWFESEQLKSVLATDAVICAWLGPQDPGSAYVLLHHVMGETGGKAGVWGYVRGGMGEVSNSIARAGEEHGLTILRESPVAQIVLDDRKRAKGVRLENGSYLPADAVVCCASPRAMCRMLDGEMDEAYEKRVMRTSYKNGNAKINLVLNALPQFTCDPPEDFLRGTIHISPTVEYLQVAFDEARHGDMSSSPMIEMTIPSTLDDTLAPNGLWVANIFTQYLSWEASDRKDAYRERVIDIIDENAPGFRDSIVQKEILSPQDLQNIMGLDEGNAFHGGMGLASLGPMRPVPGYADFTTPIDRLFLGGSGAHPGGGVTGMPGHNAAQKVIQTV